LDSLGAVDYKAHFVRYAEIPFDDQGDGWAGVTANKPPNPSSKHGFAAAKLRYDREDPESN